MLRPPPQGGAAPTFITQASFDPNYEPVNSTYPNGASGQWVVQAGDTLSAIAQATYGDSSLWYLVAQANGLGGDSDLRVGG